MPSHVGHGLCAFVQSVQCDEILWGACESRYTSIDTLTNVTVQCQKEAWKNPLFPHKVLCSKIAKLKEQLGKRAWAQLWAEDMTTAKFLALPKRPMDTKNVEAIGRILTDLKAFKMMLSDDAPLPTRK